MEPTELKGQLDAGLKELRESLGKFEEDARKEIKAAGAMTEETTKRVDKTLTEIGEVKNRLLAVEQKMTAPNREGSEEQKTIGQIVTESDAYKEFSSKGFKNSGKISVGSFGTKTAIVNATGQNQPLVPPVRVPGIFDPLVQRLTIRDLLNVVPTSGNSVEYVKESSHSSAAAPQGAGSSPQVYENVAKAESALAFSLSHEPVQTLAHWIPASRQVLDDAPMLSSYINGRMMYMLKAKEEDELLNGTASGGDLNGLVTQATAFNDSLDVSGDTDLDTIRRAILQAELAFCNVTGIVLNPTQWAGIETTKETGSGISSGMYIFANPQGVAGPRLWGRPVVSTTAITTGHFLVGDFKLACDLYDRQQASIEVSREHSDFFVKNMVAILCEERLALVTYRPGALIYGPFEASE